MAKKTHLKVQWFQSRTQIVNLFIIKKAHKRESKENLN